MKCVYRLEKVRYYNYDHLEDEDIEERLILGHFDSLERLNDAIKYCAEKGITEQEISISTYFDTFASNQKYVYILSHQYSVMINGEYTDYEYIFRPFSNIEKCKLLKNKLQQEKKFEHRNDRCYRIQPPDGFYISKQKLNVIYGH